MAVSRGIMSMMLAAANALLVGVFAHAGELPPVREPAPLEAMEEPPPAAAPAEPVSRFDIAPTRVLDNLEFFGGLDGSKGPEDLGVNANFGGRGSVNWGYPVLEVYGIGVQLGAAINYARTAVTVLESATNTHDRRQTFTTVGLFQRTEMGLNWGFGYDFLFMDYYTGMRLGQWRGRCGWAMNERNEMGMWGTIGSLNDTKQVAGFLLEMRPITQGNMYWRHIWRSEAITTFWAGMADRHQQFVLLNPGRPASNLPFVFGAEMYVPMNDYLAMWGQANFITPNDTGTVTATLGFAFYPGGRAWTAGRSRFAPMLPVANNPTFAVDAGP